MFALQSKIKTLRKKQAKKLAAFDHDASGKPKAKQDKQGNHKPNWLINHTKLKPEDLTKSPTHNGKLWWWCDESTGGKYNAAAAP